MSRIDDKAKEYRKYMKSWGVKTPALLDILENAYCAGANHILEELADHINNARFVNVRQVLEWIEEYTKE